VAEVCGDAATGTVVGEAATAGRETAEGGGGGTYVGTADVENRQVRVLQVQVELMGKVLHAAK
jgi:hypothetical protein